MGVWREVESGSEKKNGEVRMIGERREWTGCKDWRRKKVDTGWIDWRKVDWLE